MFALLIAIIYLSFISLGLPDSLLGSAWPVMQGQLGVLLSFAGIISMVICAGTVISSLLSYRLTRTFGTGVVTAVSVGMTAGALFAFSFGNRFWMLALAAVPYGLGAGGVDAALNNYVALHLKARHMSWLHCMWGLGASLGPYIMGFALSGGQGWNMGYRYIALLQVLLTAVLLFSLPLWKSHAHTPDTDQPLLSLGQIIRIPGVKAVMATFFCYCAIEQTTMLWASSYLVLAKGVPAERAAGFASLFFIGITAGRALSGFVTMKLRDAQMVRLGQGIIAAGIAAFLLPLGENAALGGFLLIGFGCAPVYPCLIHSTPERFGADKSQAIIGVQMASAYVGTCLMPPVFGWAAAHLTIALFPLYLTAILVVMIVTHQLLIQLTRTRRQQNEYA